jgi:phosphatidylglycerophosphate synthase
MWTVPNLLSFLRLPLAAVFLQEDPLYRAIAIALAMATDFLDGFYARRYQQTSKLGTLLDPITDKLFVYVALSVLFVEDRLGVWEGLAFLCRDFSVFLFSFYLLLTGRLTTYRPGSIWSGKIATALQFPMLIALALGWSVAGYYYVLLMISGGLALPELLMEARRQEQAREL